MKRVIGGICLMAIGCGYLAPGQAQAADEVFDFEGLAAGPATTCTSGLTGGGGPVDWQITKDASSPSGPNVLSEMSQDATSNRFALCIFPDFRVRNVDVRTSFKAVSGEVDQAAGLMVRVRDEDNYYVARANALEDNVRFYRVVNGRREQIEGKGTNVTASDWHTLGLRAEGDRFTVSLDGTVLFTAVDSTFQGPGNVGLWTKADSVTRFDQVYVRDLE